MNDPTPHIVWVGVVMIAGIVAFMVRAWFRHTPPVVQTDVVADDDSIEMLPLVEVDDDDDDPD